MHSTLDTECAAAPRPGPVDNAALVGDNAYSSFYLLFVIIAQSAWLGNQSVALWSRSSTLVTHILLYSLTHAVPVQAVKPSVWNSIYAMYGGGPVLKRRTMDIYGD